MSKLAKFKGGLAKAKNAAMRMKLPKAESVGKAGHEVIKFGTHAALALASKTYESLGPVPVRPDVAGTLAGAALMMLGKKDKTRNLGKAVMFGGLHAIITRMVGAENFTIINTSGSPFVPPKPATKPQPEVVESVA